MRNVIGAALAAGALMLGAPAANAMAEAPAAVGIAGSVILVDGGCGGPEFFRAPNGVCYRKREEFRREGYGEYGRPYPPPREDYYRRGGCPPGTHPTPYGCRPNY